MLALLTFNLGFALTTLSHYLKRPGVNNLIRL